jgi:hypothetical protein
LDVSVVGSVLYLTAIMWAASLANIKDHIRAQGVPHWVLVAAGFSMKSKSGQHFFNAIIQKHPVLNIMSQEEVQREITDQVWNS